MSNYYIPDFSKGLVDKSSKGKLTEDYKQKALELENFYIKSNDNLALRPPLRLLEGFEELKNVVDIKLYKQKYIITQKLDLSIAEDVEQYKEELKDFNSIPQFLIETYTEKVNDTQDDTQPVVYFIKFYDNSKKLIPNLSFFIFTWAPYEIGVNQLIIEHTNPPHPNAGILNFPSPSTHPDTIRMNTNYGAAHSPGIENAIKQCQKNISKRPSISLIYTLNRTNYESILISRQEYANSYNDDLAVLNLFFRDNEDFNRFKTNYKIDLIRGNPRSMFDFSAYLIHSDYDIDVTKIETNTNEIKFNLDTSTPSLQFNGQVFNLDKELTSTEILTATKYNIHKFSEQVESSFNLDEADIYYQVLPIKTVLTPNKVDDVRQFIIIIIILLCQEK